MRDSTPRSLSRLRSGTCCAESAWDSRPGKTSPGPWASRPSPRNKRSREAPLSAEVQADLLGRTPLWLYCLKEAEVIASSAQLGPVAGRIVAEVLVGLLGGDALSFLSVDPNWNPTLPSANAGTFTLTDLVNFAIPVAAPLPPNYPG